MNSTEFLALRKLQKERAARAHLATAPPDAG